MKKILPVLLMTIVIAYMFSSLSCRERNASQPGAEPTATMTPTQRPASIVVFDGTQSDGTNLLGGKFLTYDDRYCTGGTSQVWPPAFTGNAFIMSSPGHNGTGYAARITGNVTSGCSSGYIKLSTQLVAQSTGNCPPFDASSYMGIRFWCKGNIGTGKVFFPYVNSSCTVEDSYNNAYATINVTTNWAQIVIPFSSIIQGGAAISTVLQNLTEIQWSTVTVPLSGVDLWVDQIEFY